MNGTKLWLSNLQKIILALRVLYSEKNILLV